MRNDLWNKIANANKFEGYMYGKEIWSNPYIPDGIVYFINEDTMTMKPILNKKKIKIVWSCGVRPFCEHKTKWGARVHYYLRWLSPEKRRE